MTTPSLSADTPRGRMYRLEPDGPLMYPSITTVAGARAKDFLQGWYATMASKRALDMYAWLDRNPQRAPAEISRVTRDRWGAQKRIAAAAPEYTRSAADFGTLVHTACEDWGTSGTRPDAARIGEIIEQMRAAQGCFSAEKDPQALIARADVRLDGYGRFLDDYQPEFLEIEQTVVNHTVGYAGTTAQRSQETLSVMLDEFRRLSEGVTHEELERARQGRLTRLVMQGESSGARANRLASEMYLRGKVRTLEETADDVRSVTLEQLNSWLAANRLPDPTVVTLGPDTDGTQS